jgi:3-deoxy-manno-octulosonate cytidylyltransferase (CMP-KDO synthetase)
MNFKIIIPARYSSIRLPAKMLANIAGKPMIQHVYERAIQSGAESVVIATDDERIKLAAEKFGAKVCLTSSELESGTERIAQAARLLNYADDTIVVNIQGDEPLMPSTIISQVAENLAQHPNADMATLCTSITAQEEIFNPSAVKVVRDKNGYALYFSRAPIPWNRDTFPHDYIALKAFPYYRHLGLYAFRVQTLKQYVSWEKSPLEKIESLEQLRILWNGGRIHVDHTSLFVPGGVDTPADLLAVKSILEKSM